MFTPATQHHLDQHLHRLLSGEVTGVPRPITLSPAAATWQVDARLWPLEPLRIVVPENSGAHLIGAVKALIMGLGTVSEQAWAVAPRGSEVRATGGHLVSAGTSELHRGHIIQMSGSLRVLSTTAPDAVAHAAPGVRVWTPGRHEPIQIPQNMHGWVATRVLTLAPGPIPDPPSPHTMDVLANPMRHLTDFA